MVLRHIQEKILMALSVDVSALVLSCHNTNFYMIKFREKEDTVIQSVLNVKK